MPIPGGYGALDKTGREAGNFFIIRPHTKYLQKSPAGTRILFFKHPDGNDKTLVPLTGEMRRWCEAWEDRWEN